MWDLIISVPDHCLSFYLNNFSSRKHFQIYCFSESESESELLVVTRQKDRTSCTKISDSVKLAGVCLVPV